MTFNTPDTGTASGTNGSDLPASSGYPGSLRFRLLALAVIVLVVVLVVASLGLNRLFYSHLESRLGNELETYSLQIAGNLRFDAANRLELVRRPADPRFNRPLGGLYWQVVDITSGQELRSRSLWDERLETPEQPLSPGGQQLRNLTGPAGQNILLHERTILISGNSVDHEIHIAVAMDRNELEALAADFRNDSAIALFILGAILLLGFAAQVFAGLRPVRSLQSGINDISSGRSKRLNGNVPTEIAPLVSELNNMLEAQEREMQRAHDRASDLAHGLKTPLTALAADIRKLREKGENRIADDIEQLSARMRAHVEREMIRARIRHRTVEILDPKPTLASIVNTLKRLPGAEDIAFEVDIPSDLQLRISAHDFNEIAGNLGENAVRYAKSKIRFRFTDGKGSTVFSVEDDGPGLSDKRIGQVLARGERLDQSGDGAGLGLAIVQDIASEIGSKFQLSRSQMGGLCATVNFSNRNPDQSLPG